MIIEKRKNMKRILSLTLVLIMIFSFAACKGNKNKTAGTPISSDALPNSVFSNKFVYTSNIDEWYSSFTMKKDGSFRGKYFTEKKDSTGEDYPNGTVYYCDYYGYFTDIKQLNDYSYSLQLDKVNTQELVGKETIENGVRKIVTYPYGIESGKEFILYSPETPVSKVSSKVLVWWPYFKEHQTSPKEKLGCYAIVNTKTNEAFFILDN